MKKKEEMVLALAKEIQLRKSEFQDELIETIYFGGGTPSRLQIADLKLQIDTIYENYKVAQNPEITLEANPDDLSEEYLIGIIREPLVDDFEPYKGLSIFNIW
jgi:oxygen-independent coproporphyrinogen-3 oxidase